MFGMFSAHMKQYVCCEKVIMAKYIKIQNDTKIYQNNVVYESGQSGPKK